MSQHVAIIRLTDSADPTFIWGYLTNPTGGFSTITNSAYGQMKPGISLVQIREMEVPIPPIRIQQTFAARVTEVRALEAQQAASRQRLDDLYAALLHRAFRGEL